VSAIHRIRPTTAHPPTEIFHVEVVLAARVVETPRESSKKRKRGKKAQSFDSSWVCPQMLLGN
jgi:hypothetical protein